METLIDAYETEGWTLIPSETFHPDFYVGSYYGQSRHLLGKMKFFWFENTNNSNIVFTDGMGTCTGCTGPALCDFYDCCTTDYCAEDEYMDGSGIC